MGDGDVEPGFIPLGHPDVEDDEMLRRAKSFYSQMSSRRTTRHFSNKKVPRELIELAIRTASTAPSGAHLQPWTFVAISNSEMKARIREAAEEEERRFYRERVPEEWEEVLAPLGTDHVKSHITDAPGLLFFSGNLRERGGRGWLPHTIPRSPAALPLDCSSQRFTIWDWQPFLTPLPPWVSSGKSSDARSTSTLCYCYQLVTQRRMQGCLIWKGRDSKMCPSSGID